MKTLVGGKFGKYEVNRLLGRGGMGEVYEAYDTDKRRPVALKVLTEQFADDATFRERFLRESHAAAILQEPHVIPIHDWGEIDHTLYIDMRLVEGRTLHDILAERTLTPERAVEIIGQVAAALDAAHSSGLIHRRGGARCGSTSRGEHPRSPRTAAEYVCPSPGHALVAPIRREGSPAPRTPWTGGVSRRVPAGQP